MDTLTTTIASDPEVALGAGLLVGLGAGLIAFITIFSLILTVLLVIAWWKIFTKAGEKGWKAIIPIYNTYILFKLFWNTKMFWITIGTIFGCSLLSSILQGVANGVISSILTFAYAIFGLVIDIMLSNRQSKSFGHGTGFTLGLIFLPNIFTLILGFNKDKYKKLAA